VTASAQRVRIGALECDPVTLGGALDAIDELVRAKAGGRVFTPNVDHVVQVEQDARFRAAYADASLSLVDGMPLMWAAKLLKTPLPEKVSGSDLILPLMRRAAERGHRVYFLGGAPGAAAIAQKKLLEQFPALRIVGTDAARIDVNGGSDVQGPILERIAAAKPDLLLVALGAPKQEIWSHEQRAQLGTAVAIGVGASLDFIAGVQRRAPRWLSDSGLEWAFRLAQDPRRMAGRYLIRDPQFFGIVARQMLAPRPGPSENARR
jgi:N-acetylglucosaminyldiphosphoundecaprenol N-acetyl-beta-D-mannosaminyltransferase